MTHPIVPASLYQQAVFETIKAANKAAQSPDFGPDYRPADNIVPTVAPYIFNYGGNHSDFLI